MLNIQYEKFLAIFATFALIGSVAIPTAIAQAPILEKKVILDYSEPTHTGKSFDACGDGSRKYSTFSGGLKWFSFPISYHIDAPSSSAKAAVVAGFNEWDNEGHPAGALFSETAGTADIVVSWAPIDGSGNVLAQTTFWYNPFTKEIVEAEIVFDSGDNWFVAARLSCSATGNSFDIQDVAVHEIGHSLGLGHVSDPALTMYRYASPGETLKRSLGNGDQRGLDRLY